MKRLFPSGFIFLAVCFLFFFASFSEASAARFFLSPSSGSQEIGSTFEVSLFLDTEGKSVNVVDVTLAFPSQQLQLVSPSLGKSVVELWVAQPVFDNERGTVRLQGGIPGGLNVSKGLISTLRFRVRNTGMAYMRFLDGSRVLLNDGKGTDALINSEEGVYNLVLPPSVGPSVFSTTHPDSQVWYKVNDVSFSWNKNIGDTGYSYTLSSEPSEVPDNIPEGVKADAYYDELVSGVYYFHIKALNNGRWGGVSHYAVHVDTAPPASFSLEVSPSERTTSEEVFLRFFTTDQFSGIDRYELKTVPLSAQSSLEDSEDPFSVEVTSPRLLTLSKGAYDLILRAYDKAGNYRDVVKRVDVVAPWFQIVQDQGVEIKEWVIIPWVGFFLLVSFLLVIFGYGVWVVERWHRKVVLRSANTHPPEHVRSLLEELKQYHKKYGGVVAFLLIVSSLLLYHPLQAAVYPPVITSVSRNISNEEIFYIGGKTELPYTDVSIHLQNSQNGEVFTYHVVSDSKGDWFYRHPTFLSVGTYSLWVFGGRGEEVSVPSSQTSLTVQKTALQIGSSRVSYGGIYVFFIVILSLLLLSCVLFILFRFRHIHAHKRRFLHEVKDVEASIRAGFAILKRDLESELRIVRKSSGGDPHLLHKEHEIQRDLAVIEARIGKELLDIHRLMDRS